MHVSVHDTNDTFPPPAVMQKPSPDWVPRSAIKSQRSITPNQIVSCVRYIGEDGTPSRMHFWFWSGPKGDGVGTAVLVVVSDLDLDAVRQTLTEVIGEIGPIGPTGPTGNGPA